MANDPFLHEKVYRDNLEALYHAPVLVAGCGAIGSNLAETLVRHGCDNITILDMDRVEMHNLGTQIWTDNDIGLLKTAALSNRLYDITKTEASIISKELTHKNIDKLLKPFRSKDSIVIDCFDNMESRMLLKIFCEKNGINCIHAGLFEDYGEVYWNDDYNVPSNPIGEVEDVCDYALARNIIMLTVTVLCEEILNWVFSPSPRMKNWSITLKDLTIRQV